MLTVARPWWLVPTNYSRSRSSAVRSRKRHFSQAAGGQDEVTDDNLQGQPFGKGIAAKGAAERDDTTAPNVDLNDASGVSSSKLTAVSGVRILPTSKPPTSAGR